MAAFPKPEQRRLFANRSTESLRDPSMHRECSYFNDVLIVAKLLDSLLPTPFTAVMIAIAIPAAIKPYSIAVAPVSSAMKSCSNFFIFNTLTLTELTELAAGTRKHRANDHAEHLHRLRS
jgi:hypothetical protein